MRYLSGVTNDRDEPTLIAAGVGVMAQPGSGYGKRVGRYPMWAADNGCFSDKWQEDRWLRWLDGLTRDRCLFAVAPDVYPDALATLERSSGYFDLIRDMGFPVALVAQNGAEHLDLPWDDFDCLFIGGASAKPSWSEWKVSDDAAGLVGEARSRGKWVHMGRVNSLARIDRAREMGCNSADGTFLKYRLRGGSVDRGAFELANWLVWLDSHPALPYVRHETPSLPIHKVSA